MKLGDIHFAELKGGRQVGCLHLRGGDDGMLTDMDSGESFDTTQLSDRLFAFVARAKMEQRSIARFIFTQYGNLSIEAQCSVLRDTRAAREQNADFTVQTIISGVWNFFRVQEHWKKHHDELSPAPDRKHVFFQSRPDCEDILSRLITAKLVSDPPSNFDKVCAEMLTEVTGGDGFILDYITSSLKAQHLHLEAVESTLAQTVESGELIVLLKRRTAKLGVEAWELLLSILNHQFVSRLDHDVDAEDLRLAGLIMARFAGIQKRLAVSSPIIERILRDKWAYIGAGQPPVYRGNDLARAGLARNAAAYRLVAHIENTLRNLIVLSLSNQEDWTERLDRVHVDAPGNFTISNELLGILRQVLESSGYRGDAFEAAFQAAFAGMEGDAPEVQAQKKNPKVSVVESARNWRSRVKSSTILELAGDSLVYFLTTANLSTILLNEKQKIYPEAFQRIFPDRHELLNMIEQYRVIRDAVAHNQPISLATVKRLENISADIEKRICNAQAQS